MSEFTVEIPEELEAYIKAEGYSNPEDYIQVVLIRPLMEKYEYKRKQEELKKIEPTLNKEFKKHREKVAIRKLEKEAKKTTK